MMNAMRDQVYQRINSMNSNDRAVLEKLRKSAQ